MLSSLALSFLYFCLSSILFELSSFAHTLFFTNMLCTSLLLFNFQGSFPPPLSRRPCYYTTSVSTCQYLFQSFLNFFQVFSSSIGSRSLVALAVSLIIIPRHQTFVKHFFRFFIKKENRPQKGDFYPYLLDVLFKIPSQTSLLPSKARKSVISSAYSRSAPTGTP